jgi:hypothetical protein
MQTPDSAGSAACWHIADHRTPDEVSLLADTRYVRRMSALEPEGYRWTEILGRHCLYGNAVVILVLLLVSSLLSCSQKRRPSRVAGSMPLIPHTRPTDATAQCRPKGSSGHGKLPTMARQPASTGPTRVTAPTRPQVAALRGHGKPKAPSSAHRQMGRHRDKAKRRVGRGSPGSAWHRVAISVTRLPCITAATRTRQSN